LLTQPDSFAFSASVTADAFASATRSPAKTAALGMIREMS